jgi:hypothetical protein
VKQALDGGAIAVFGGFAGSGSGVMESKVGVSLTSE